MTKLENQTDPTSCWNTALWDEQVFILKENDKAMAATIRFWVGERLRLGLNLASDMKIDAALKIAEKLEGK